MRPTRSVTSLAAFSHLLTGMGRRAGPRAGRIRPPAGRQLALSPGGRIAPTRDWRGLDRPRVALYGARA